MILQGKNLIISKDGEALYASKSCDLNVQAETIPVSSPVSGLWKYSISGRKSWSLTTNHLLMSPAKADGKIAAVSQGWIGNGLNSPSVIIDGNGTPVNISQRGLTAVRLAASSPYTIVSGSLQNWDTYGTDPDTLINSFGEYMEHSASDIVAIVGWDAFQLPQTWADILLEYLNIDVPAISTGRQALAVISSLLLTTGVYAYTGNDGKQQPVARTARTELFLQNGNVLTATPLRDALSYIGQTFTLKASVLGLPYDEIEGAAICKQFRITATTGNMIQGSFAWEGNGPLS